MNDRPRHLVETVPLMNWDDEDMNDNQDQEEVKRVKKVIGEMDIKPVISDEVSLSMENNQVGNQKWNRKRQVKRRVNDHRYKTVYNVGKTKNPYLLTRNAVVMMMEEELGVEILVRGKYKPPELNHDVDDKDALLFEISAPTPGELQEAMFSFLHLIKMMGSSRGRLRLGKHVKRNGITYHSLRIPFDSENERLLSDLNENTPLIAQEHSVEINIRGRHSGYIESCFNEEASGPTYIHIVSKSKSNLRSAEASCEEILRRHK